jgi:hypothetical protein
MGEAVVLAAAEWAGTALTAAEVASAAAVVNSVAFAAASMAYSARQQSLARADARAQANASLKDREVMLRTAIAPMRVVYGRDRISGPMVYWQTTGPKKEFLHLVVALAAHECDAIETVLLNDVELPEPDAQGFITSGEFARLEYPLAVPVGGTTNASGEFGLPEGANTIISVTTGTGEAQAAVSGYSHTSGSSTITGLPASTQVFVDYTTTVAVKRVRVRKHLGQPGQVADAELVAESGGLWTAEHVGNATCYLALRLEFDVEVFGQIGLPNPMAIVRGKKVFDPRTGLTVWSDNAALCTADRLRDAEFGLAATAAQVPEAELIAEANIADEWVQVDFSALVQRRYTFSGSFTTDTPPRESLAALAQAMAGDVVWSQGRWLIRAGAYRVPTTTWGENVLAGKPITLGKATMAERINAVRVTHRDIANKWAEVSVTVSNPLYVAADGGGQPLTKDLRLETACDTKHAQRLGKIELERARQALRLGFTASLRGYNAAPTDCIALAWPTYGWAAGKAFEVVERQWSTGLEVAYTLRETAPSVYAWNYGEATTYDDAPDTSLPSPYAAPPPPGSLSVDTSAAHQLRLSDGTLVSRALVQWPAATAAFVLSGGRVEVEWAIAGSTEFQAAEPVPGNATRTYLSAVPPGRVINVRARFVNAAGRSSAHAYATPHPVQRLATQRGDLLAETPWQAGTTGTQGAAPRRFTAHGGAAENSIILGPGPDGSTQLLWRCLSADGTADEDGGWLTDPWPINPTQAYRIDQWFQCLGEMGGRAYLGAGPGAVRNIGGAALDYADFISIDRAPLVPGRWYVMVGYILPAGYSGAAPGMSGVWDGLTGQRVHTGTDFQFRAEATHLPAYSFFYYGNVGAEQRLARPNLWLVDGSEPTVAERLALSINARLQALATLQLTTQGEATAMGNLVRKTGSTVAFDASAHSTESYTHGAAVVWSVTNTTDVYMVGLNTDPASGPSFTGIDWALYCDQGTLRVYENGSYQTGHGAYAAGDSLAVTYDGATIRYWRNGVVLRQVAASIAAPLFLDTSLYNPGAVIAGLKFGPQSPVNDIGTSQLQPEATFGSVFQSADGWSVGPPPIATSTNHEEDIVVASWPNTTGEATRVQFEVGFSGSGMTYNGSRPTDTWARMQWSSATLSGSKTLQSGWPSPAEFPSDLAATLAWEVVVPAGETFTAKLRVHIVHNASAKIFGDHAFARIYASKR